MPSARDRLIVACDTPSPREALRLAKQLKGTVRWLKVGSILFTAAGPAIIRQVRALGFRVFLDLKFHDIPSTVEKSCYAAARHGVGLLTVHACGQREMLEAAAAGAKQGARDAHMPRPKVVGVTVLTSIGAAPWEAVSQLVLELASECRQAGLDGVVASAQEAEAIRRALGPKFLIVCPGIRLPVRQAGPASGARDDQVRVATPAAAIAAGASMLVVGRPITGAPDPREAARKILADIGKA